MSPRKARFLRRTDPDKPMLDRQPMIDDETVERVVKEDRPGKPKPPDPTEPIEKRDLQWAPCGCPMFHGEIMHSPRCEWEEPDPDDHPPEPPENGELCPNCNGTGLIIEDGTGAAKVGCPVCQTTGLVAPKTQEEKVIQHAEEIREMAGDQLTETGTPEGETKGAESETPEPEVDENEDFGEIPTGDYGGEDPVKEQIADMFQGDEEEDEPAAMVELTEDEAFQIAIQEGREAQIMDHTVYRLQTLKMETKEKKDRWKDFKALMLAAAATFFDARADAIHAMEEKVKNGLALMGVDFHETAANIRVSLTKPNLRNIPVETAEGALEEMSDNAVNSWPFLEIERKVKMNKSALRDWIKAEAEKKYPPNKKEDEETKAKRIAYAIKIIRKVPFLTCEVPEYGLRVTPRGFDPFTSLRQIMGPDDAEEILEILDTGYERSET